MKDERIAAIVLSVLASIFIGLMTADYFPHTSALVCVLAGIGAGALLMLSFVFLEDYGRED